MKSFVTSLAIMAATLPGWTAQPAPAMPVEGIDLVLPGNTGCVRLLEVSEGQKVAAAWEAFLADWFSYFDRNADAWLSREEAGRIFAVPLANGRPIAFDFEQCDADKDGKVTLREMTSFYLDAGFRPVQAIVEPPSLRDVQVADAIFRHLGADDAGVLTMEKLKGADRLLRKLDENEDEVLTMAEVLSLGIDKSLKSAPKSEIQFLHPTDQPVLATISVAPFNSKPPLLRIENSGKQRVLSIPPGISAEPRIQCGKVVLAFSKTSDYVAKALASSRHFVVAQFHNVVGGKGWLEKRQVANDPALQLLADIFPHADRDADGKLTLKELEQFLSLLEQGATCVRVVRVRESGRNLFCHLDTNGDGRLEMKELKAAAQVMTALDAGNQWKRDQVPFFVRITLDRGLSGDSFGPLPLVKLPATSVAAGKPALAAKAPAWFLAMDLNGDGYVSMDEFLGPAELFRILDANGDGLISIEEAAKAKDLKRVG